PAGDSRAGAPFLEQRDRLDVRLRELRVLLDTGRDGEDVRVEDQILGREARLAGKQVVGAPADLDLPLDRVRLALLVEGHHDDAGPVVPDLPRLLQERRLAPLEAE